MRVSTPASFARIAPLAAARKPSLEEVILKDEAILTEPAGQRTLGEPLAGNTQGPLLWNGECAFQLTTETLYAAGDEDVTAVPLEHPRSSAHFQGPTTGPDGTLYYVNQTRKRILAFREDHVNPVVDIEGEDPYKGPCITSALSVDPDGGLLYGTGDAKIHRLKSDGTTETLATLPYKRTGWGFIFAEPTTIQPGKGGRLFVGTPEGVVALDQEGRPSWVRPLKLVRAGHDHPVLVSPDGETIYHTGTDSSMVAIRVSDGEVKWTYKLDPDEGDCFNRGAVDPEGNIYSVSGQGILLKVSPEGRSLWKKTLGLPMVGSVVTGARVAFDADGNVCVNPDTRSFHVYSADGVPLLKMTGDGAFDGGNYVFDFVLTHDGHRACLRTTKPVDHQFRNQLVELELPGPAEPLMRSLPSHLQGPQARIERGEAGVRVGGILVPRRPA